MNADMDPKHYQSQLSQLKIFTLKLDWWAQEKLVPRCGTGISYLIFK